MDTFGILIMENGLHYKMSANGVLESFLDTFKEAIEDLFQRLMEGEFF